MNNANNRDGGGALGTTGEHFALYAAKLAELAGHNKTYRCFCRPDVLEDRAMVQRLAGQPERYDRACALLPKDRVQRKLDAKLPYIWRLRLNDDQILEIRDRSGAKLGIRLEDFSDFELTRPDGSFSPIFTSFVDDAFVFHTPLVLSGALLQEVAMRAALYDAFMLKIPVFAKLSPVK